MRLFLFCLIGLLMALITFYLACRKGAGAVGIVLCNLSSRSKDQSSSWLSFLWAFLAKIDMADC